MSEPYVIKMPQLSDTMTEGVIVSWEKAIGDPVRRGDIVATVETDKAVMDVEVFRDGFLSGPIAPVDAVVAVTHPIAYLVESKEEVVEGTGAPAVQSTTSRPGPAAHAPTPTSPATAVAARGISAATVQPGSAPLPRPQGIKASPLARKLAGQLHVDLDRLDRFNNQ